MTIIQNDRFPKGQSFLHQNDRLLSTIMTVICTKMTFSQAKNDRYKNFGITTVILVQNNGNFGIEQINASLVK